MNSYRPFISPTLILLLIFTPLFSGRLAQSQSPFATDLFIHSKSIPAGAANPVGSVRRPASPGALDREQLENRFDLLLNEIKKVLNVDTNRQQLAALKQELARKDVKNREYFHRIQEAIKHAGLPAEVLERHNHFVRVYMSRYE